MVPVLVLGGQANAIAIVRGLSRRGIPVHVAASPDCIAFRSRHCAGRLVYDPGRDAAALADLLIDRTPDHLRGCVLFPCNDEAIVFVADHYDALRARFILPEFVPDLQRAMLDKRQTLALGRRAGVPAPNFWDLRGPEELDEIRGEITFPVMIKPIHSHLFQRAFPGRKFFTASTMDELRSRAREVADQNLAAMVCEIIPGADDLASSYYTYIDDRGEQLFRATKRVIRRFPMNQGGATYHITEWLPETAELGERFFRGIGFRGNAVVEFKRDPRDNTLKLIECNARFAAAQWVFVRAGFDLAYFVYCKVTNRPLPEIRGYREYVRLWHPVEDYWAFRELRAKGLLTLRGWLQSILHRQNLPYLTAGDPWPAVVVFSRLVRQKFANMVGAPPGP